VAQIPVIDPTDANGEARRIATICNACRYCEGVCAVFPALELRRAFTDGDLRYLANLCHGCGACYYDCQFSPPHEFKVHMPQTLARVRVESYQHYAWPSAFAVAFERHGLVISVLVALSVAAFIVAMGGATGETTAAIGSGAFYRTMPHGLMAGLFGAAFAFSCLSLGIGAARFRAELARSETPAAGHGFWAATADSGRLRYLDGGGVGCMSHDERPNDVRRLFHHFTFYGFMLCFASTVVATGYHYLLEKEAPYDWLSMPVILGTLGGSGLLIGTMGLLVARVRRDPELRLVDHQTLDVAFVFLLWATAATGLLLLAARSTPAMPLLLAVHLGVVFALFVSLPYGKFVHGIYRFIALQRYAAERSALRAGPVGEE
jgi:citrate/tricarballylate utilization protein